MMVIALVGIRSNAQVVQAWASIYNGAGNGYDYAYAMTIDRSGNTYVTGQAYTGVNNDCTTIKYNSNGDTVWVRNYNGPGNNTDMGNAIAVDREENVYITGATYGSVNKYDIVTIKYDSAGVQQWASRYDGPGHGSDEGIAIAVDTSGNVYVTGDSPGTSGSDDYVTIKYNSTGDTLWSARYNGPGAYHDDPHALAIDNSGNVYVTGQSSGSGTGYDYATIKYNSSGIQQWAARYDDSLQSDIASSIAIDNSGNVYVTGSSGTSISHGGYATIKYNSAGTQQWIARYDNGGDDAAYALVSDGGNGLYVTGVGRGTASPYSYDYLTIRYDASTGDTVWTARYNGSGNGDDYAEAIALDRLGNVYVTGYSIGVSSGDDFATLCYNSSGVQQWVERYTTAGNNTDAAIALAVDTLGNVYVAGYGYDAIQYNNYITVKYQDASLPVELTSFSATVHGGDVQLVWNTATEVNNYGFEIERLQNQNWSTIGFVAGAGTSASPRSYSYEDKNIPPGTYAYRIKQIDKDGSSKYTNVVDVVAGLAPLAFDLSQNYPNPFNPTTTIEFTLPSDGRVVLKVYDITGKEVAALLDENMKAGVYQQAVFDASRFASGVYFARLQFAGKQLLKKLVLVK